MSLKPKRVLYVVPRFPYLNTTFIANEMAALRGLGVEILVSSVWPHMAVTRPHQVERPFLDKTFYLELCNLSLWFGALTQLVKKPQLFILILRLCAGHLASVYSLLKLLASIPKGLYLGQWVQEHKLDHIHAHFLSSPATVALLASKASGVPFSVTAHAFDIFSSHPQTMSGSVPLKCHSAVACILISEFNGKYLRSKWPILRQARLEVIYNGIDPDLFVPKPSSEISRVVLSDRERFWKILSNGSLTTKKGHAILIQAISRLLRRGVLVELNIVGRGPLEDSLRSLVRHLGIERWVHFLGTIPQDDLVQLYRKADVFVLASIKGPDGDMDGLPTVLIEALAMELPTTSTRISGIPEVIHHGVTGLCVSPGNIGELTDAIEWVIRNPLKAKAMAKRGRQLVLERFDMRKNAGKLLQLWQEIHAKQLLER